MEVYLKSKFDKVKRKSEREWERERGNGEGRCQMFVFENWHKKVWQYGFYICMLVDLLVFVLAVWILPDEGGFVLSCLTWEVYLEDTRILIATAFGVSVVAVCLAHNLASIFAVILWLYQRYPFKWGE